MDLPSATRFVVLELLLLCAASYGKSSPNTYHNYTCPKTLTVTNARLHGGFSAGTFKRLGSSAFKELCIQRCCERVTCDLLAWIGDHCYSVSCYSEDLCHPVRLPATDRGATLLYIVSRKEGDQSGNHNEPATQVDALTRDRRIAENYRPSTPHKNHGSTQPRKQILLNEFNARRDIVKIRKAMAESEKAVKVGSDHVGEKPLRADELEVSRSGYFSGESDFTSGSAAVPSLIFTTLGEEESGINGITSTPQMGSLHGPEYSTTNAHGSALSAEDVAFKVQLEEGSPSGDASGSDIMTKSGESNGSADTSGSDITTVSGFNKRSDITSGSGENSGYQIEGFSATSSTFDIEPEGNATPSGMDPISGLNGKVGKDATKSVGETEEGNGVLILPSTASKAVQGKQRHVPKSQDSLDVATLQNLGKAGLKTKDEWLTNLAMKINRYGNANMKKLKHNVTKSAITIISKVSQANNAANLNEKEKTGLHLADKDEAKTNKLEQVAQNRKVVKQVSRVEQEDATDLGTLSKQGYVHLQNKPIKPVSPVKPVKLVNSINHDGKGNYRNAHPLSKMLKPASPVNEVNTINNDGHAKNILKPMLKPVSPVNQVNTINGDRQPNQGTVLPQKNMLKEVSPVNQVNTINNDKQVKEGNAHPQSHMLKPVSPVNQVNNINEDRQENQPHPQNSLLQPVQRVKPVNEHQMLKHDDQQEQPASQNDLTNLASFVNQVHSIYMASRQKDGKNIAEDPEVTRQNEMKLIEKAALMLNNQNNKAQKSPSQEMQAEMQRIKTAGVGNLELSDQMKMAHKSFFNSKQEKAKILKADPLYEALSKLRFGNKPSLVTSSSRFQYLKQCGLYVEEHNVSRTGGSWNTHVFEPYSYLYEVPERFSKCKTEAWFNNTDMRGSVFLSFQVKSILGSTMMNNARVCAKYCCNELRCRAWTLRLQMAKTRNCDKGSFCCWLKSAVPTLIPGVDYMTSGIVQRDNSRDPPVGMRSAVPLGGLGTGSFELRADGTFHEWTIENQSPGGSAKLNKGALDLAVLGVRIADKNGSKAVLLRTHAPEGYPGVQALQYSGAHPVSKLTVQDNMTEHVGMDLYAYPAFHPRDPYKSAVPAVAFTLSLVNRHENEPINASLLLNLPLGYQEDTIRVGDNYGEVVFTRNIQPADCARACARMPKCMAWTTNGPSSCLLKDKMPLHAWAHGIVSGLKGNWTADSKRSMLTLQRPGFYPQSGSTTLHPVGGSDRNVSFAVSYDFEDIWKNFTKTGAAGLRNTSHAGLHGAATVSTTLEPGQSTTLTIIMSWHYPNRDQAKVRIGNFYNNFLKSSRGAAAIMRKDLLNSVRNIQEWQAPLLLTTPPLLADSTSGPERVNRLPLWLQDMLVNSVSYWRSAFWTEDGRFRQWEAFDCNDVNTIHNDMHRIMPYILFYPEAVRHLLLSWASNQYSNGRMQEALTEGCLGSTGKLDYAGGRVMSDSSAMFVVEVYHYYLWTGDRDLLRKLWPNTRRAVTWLIGDSTKGTGLPFRRPSSYDLTGLDKYDHDTYESVIYLLALRAAQELSVKMDDKAFNVTVTRAYERAQWLIGRELWDERMQYYRAWWDAEYGASDWIMSDSLYGQVWANTLGFGDLLPRQKMQIHLENEIKYNDSPYGLRVLNTGEPAISLEDTALVLSRKIPGCSSLENVTKHNSVWMGADSNWASLMLTLGANPDTSLKQAQKALDHWRSGLKDQWNIHGLISSDGYGQDGLPWATSHYNSHLVMWHIPFSASGQQYSAPDKALTFWPKFEIPFELPFFTPTASGLIMGAYAGSGTDIEEMFTFKVTSGSIELKRLAILGSYYGQGEISLTKASQVTWSRPKESVASILRDLR